MGMLTKPILRVMAVVALIVAAPSAQGVPRLDSYNGVAVRILQSNNAGDIHHIIDPTINRVVGIIRGCPHAHNLTVHPDGLVLLRKRAGQDRRCLRNLSSLGLVADGFQKAVFQGLSRASSQ